MDTINSSVSNTRAPSRLARAGIASGSEPRALAVTTLDYPFSANAAGSLRNSARVWCSGVTAPRLKQSILEIQQALVIGFPDIRSADQRLAVGGLLRTLDDLFTRIRMAVTSEVGGDLLLHKLLPVGREMHALGIRLRSVVIEHAPCLEAIEDQDLVSEFFGDGFFGGAPLTVARNGWRLCELGAVLEARAGRVTRFPR